MYDYHHFLFHPLRFKQDNRKKREYAEFTAVKHLLLVPYYKERDDYHFSENNYVAGVQFVPPVTNHFQPNILFLYTRKRLKIFRFLNFSGGMEIEHLANMGYFSLYKERQYKQCCFVKCLTLFDQLIKFKSLIMAMLS